MNAVTRTIRQTWRSAQLYIGFHRDQKGNKRDEAKVWPPKNASATIHADPEVQEAFVVVKPADKTNPREVQIKLRPDQIVLRRDPGDAWEGIVVTDTSVSVQVNGIWVHIRPDGAISHELDGDTTFVESDGTVLKKTEFVEASMSGDGVELTRRTDDTIAVIGENGVMAKARKTSLLGN